MKKKIKKSNKTKSHKAIQHLHAHPFYSLAFFFVIILFISVGVMLVSANKSSIRIKEFGIPTAQSYPSYITSGPDGNLWFTERNVNKIGQITTRGKFKEFTVPSSYGPYGPDAITSGPDGNLWFTTASGNIGNISTNGTFNVNISIPHANDLEGITTGPDGNLWVTDYTNNSINVVSTSGTFLNEFTIPTTKSGVWGIAKGPDNNLWFTENLVGKVGRITTSGVITEYNLPVPTCAVSNCIKYAEPFGITAGPDGNIWFTDSINNSIGSITPTGTVTEYPIPQASSGPFYITSGSDGNLWFTENSDTASVVNNLGRITTSGVITEYATPTNISLPLGITSGSDGNIWFTETNGNSIGRIHI